MIDLYHCTVQIKMQRIPHASDIVNGRKDLVRRPAASMTDHRDALLLQKIQRLHMAFHDLLRSSLNVEHEHAKAPLFCNRRIQLPQCSGRQISGIGRRLPALLLHLLVEALKILMRHIDLTAKLQALIREIQNLLHIRNHQCIGGHIFADKAVAPRLRKDQMKPFVLLLFIANGHGKSVHLDLHGEQAVRMQLMHLGNPRLHILFGKNILDREHRHIVSDLDTGFAFPT